MKLGTFLYFPSEGADEALIKEKFRYLAECGFSACQIVYKPRCYKSEDAKKVGEYIAKYSSEYGIDLSAQFCGFYDAETVWDNYYGFLTAGINVEAYKQSRIAYIKSAAEFAHSLGIEDVITHAGFVPNNPFSPEYTSMLAAVNSIALYLKKMEMNLLFETGGESPIVLKRLIEDVGMDNLYINFDPANIFMYGYGNATDALEVFGKYVRNMHGKDGMLPTDTRKIGVETPMGKGKVDFPAIIKKFREIGYDRYIIIEREISGEQQKIDILAAKQYLEGLLAE